MLDFLPEAQLYWVGNCNELNAGLCPPPRRRARGEEEEG